ncbi:hypothetical protein Nepgr_015847 [Nepenthes gracilis]|uniref:Uncharacterized protein n=1 Tax=Nepenthes gracilis TaxID=150966 RepID=A0AAD3SPC3_NEPGR|nr:hypothetical protein Nepgr_015847 [Nepenthes gracilis]
MDAARSPSLSPCSPQSGSIAHCSGLVWPVSPAVLGSISASVYSQSAPFGESAHSDYLPGAVEVKPNNSSTAGSPGKSKLPPGISWAQGRSSSSKNLALGSLLELALSVEVEIIYHSKPARNSSGVQYNQKHVPMARDYGVERMCAATCLPSDLVPGNEGGGGQSAHLASPTGAILPAPASGLVDGLGVGMEVNDLGPIVAPSVVAGGSSGPLVFPNVVQHVLNPSSCSLDTPESIARITRKYSLVEGVEGSLIKAPSEFPDVSSSPLSGCPVEGSEVSLAGAVLPCDLERGLAHALPMSPSKQEHSTDVGGAVKPSYATVTVLPHVIVHFALDAHGLLEDPLGRITDDGGDTFLLLPTLVSVFIADAETIYPVFDVLIPTRYPESNLSWMHGVGGEKLSLLSRNLNSFAVLGGRRVFLLASDGHGSGSGDPLPPNGRFLDRCNRVCKAFVEVEVIYHSKPVCSSSGPLFSRKHAANRLPKARTSGVTRMGADSPTALDSVNARDGHPSVGVVKPLVPAHVAVHELAGSVLGYNYTPTGDVGGSTGSLEPSDGANHVLNSSLDHSEGSLVGPPSINVNDSSRGAHLPTLSTALAAKQVIAATLLILYCRILKLVEVSAVGLGAGAFCGLSAMPMRCHGGMPNLFFN